MGPYAFEVLAPTHQVGAFVSGVPEIDTYLREHAAIEREMGLCQVWVIADQAGTVWGFGTLSPVSVKLDDRVVEALGLQGAPYRQIGGYLLGRMGVHRSLQGRGIGSSMVTRLAGIAAQQRDVTGGVFLAVDAKDEGLVAFYERLGFMRLITGQRRLVLSLSSVRP